ncbi:MAG TPA: alkaline phosphatase family protein, partial [Microbacteriaceae bacterium]|nr:alkaline phosphatase family protein [Microbacteriaceae bacterium]
MSQMLPTRSVDSVRLADVLTSSLAAIHAESNPLALPAVDSVIVLVVDGLGMHNLSARSGHARTLLGGIKRAVLSSTYPATTATALTTLTTGVDSGVHGLTGYSIAARQSGKVFNQLTGWGIDMPPSSWQRATTVFEHAKAADVRADVIAHGKFAGTGFTEAVLRGAEFCASDRLGDRFELAVERSRQRGVIYLYVSELDAIAHRVGWESGEWIAALEDLDAAVRDTLPRLGRRTGMLLTADHGVIDVPAHQHLLIDERAPELLDGVVATAGDPRALT